MYLKKSLSLLVILIFGCVLCIAAPMNSVRAQQRGITSTSEETIDEEDATRTESFYESNTTTTAWGGVMNQYQFGPDVGWGETGYGYSYTDPLTGASVSYHTTGVGTGAVPLPMYGGMNSSLAAASYGPYAYGQRPVSQATLGYDTQQMISGNAFGQQSSFQVAQPNYTALTGLSMLGNTATAGLGYALLYSTAARPGLGAATSPFGGLGSYGVGAYPSAFGSSAYGYGTPYTSAYGNPYQTQSVYGNPYQSQSVYGNPYQAQSVYGNPYQSQSVYGNPYQSTYGNAYTSYGASPYGYSGYGYY